MTGQGRGVVGVLLDDADDWRRRLAPLLPDERIEVVAPAGAGSTAGAGSVADASSVDVLVVGNPDPAELARFPALRFVQSAWAGPDRLTGGVLPPGVAAARLVDDSLTDAMVEYVAAWVLALHRQLPVYRAQQAARQWTAHAQPLARERVVGLLGYGALGLPVTETLAGLGFRVVAWARRAREAPVEVVSGATGLDDLLRRADIVVNLLPLTPETRGILDADRLARLPHGASIVNCGRGAHVDVDALLAALDAGQLAHAVLDVFDDEPLPVDSPLWDHPGVTVTPHVAAASEPRLAARAVADNIVRHRSGHPVLNPL
ncbi:MAG: glyoxylate/hydroxypyruvate reductase A [Actinomycetota bacterium]|nr:glyoxylate/hydroxypyruvate reductase A [Actinomycetota bacterium]